MCGLKARSVSCFLAGRGARVFDPFAPLFAASFFTLRSLHRHRPPKGPSGTTPLLPHTAVLVVCVRRCIRECSASALQRGRRNEARSIPHATRDIPPSLFACGPQIAVLRGRGLRAEGQHAATVCVNLQGIAHGVQRLGIAGPPAARVRGKGVQC
jgi:hypothetical protein